jgi:hypothetical protein
MNTAGRDDRFPPPTQQEAARVERLATALLRTIDNFGAETGDLTIGDAGNALLTCLVRTVKSCDTAKPQATDGADPDRAATSAARVN